MRNRTQVRKYEREKLQQALPRAAAADERQVVLRFTRLSAACLRPPEGKDASDLRPKVTPFCEDLFAASSGKGCSTAAATGADPVRSARNQNTKALD